MAALRTRSALLAGPVIAGILGLVPACHAGAPRIENDAVGGSAPAGLYILEAAVGAQTVPVRLELLSMGGRPWGRMTVMAGRPIVSAVRGTDRAGETWDFVVGGPVRALQLRFGADVVTGTIVLGGGPPIPVEGQRINGPLDEHGAFVAADGSSLVLTSAGERPGSVGGDDLYVSVRTDSGWSPPGALELPVNTFAKEYGAWVSPLDGYLYFTSDRYGQADIFRVDARTAGLPTAR